MSVPELVHSSAVHNDTEEPYKTGDGIRLQLPAIVRQNSDRAVNARIIKAFAPFSTAGVMVVHIFKPTLGVEGDFLLRFTRTAVAISSASSVKLSVGVRYAT